MCLDVIRKRIICPFLPRSCYPRLAFLSFLLCSKPWRTRKSGIILFFKTLSYSFPCCGWGSWGWTSWSTTTSVWKWIRKTKNNFQEPRAVNENKCWERKMHLFLVVHGSSFHWKLILWEPESETWRQEFNLFIIRQVTPENTAIN